MSDPDRLPEREETRSIIASLPGGAEVLDWFGDEQNFGDAEVLELILNRHKPSTLRIEVMCRNALGGDSAWRRAVMTFSLIHMVDVQIEGFSHQNVIDDLYIRQASARPFHPTQIGVGLALGDHEIEMTPIFGAFGTIRGTIVGIAIEPIEDEMQTDW